VAAKLGPGDVWTREAEETLIKEFWRLESAVSR